MTGRLTRLRLEADLLAAEVTLLEDLIAAGIMPKGARRQPTAVELAAGVRFAELNRIVDQSAGLAARKAERVREHTLDGLANALAGVAGESNPWAAVEELTRLTDPTRPDTIPGLTALIDDVAAEIATDLQATAAAGAAEALDEARRQGIPDHLIGDVFDDPNIATAARAHASRIAAEPASRLLDVAAEAGARAATTTGATGLDVLEAALDGAEQASRAGVEDLTRQGANVTHGLGRAAAQAALPAPAEVYASELLDANTCGPCATVDGRTYTSLEDGLVDYPGAGGYVGCEGGSRCRGTLVLVHSTEAAPTLDGPGDGRPGPGGGPADRTPQGPSNPTIPPTPDPDLGVPMALTPPPAILDDAGTAVMPPPEPPVATVAPESVARDPELAEFNDDELDRLLSDDTAPMDRRMAAADELDQRAAGNRTQVYAEDDLDPATLARYEEEREAWEAAGGYAADDLYGLGTPATGAPAGRRIDRVRSDWADQLHMDYLSAEDATRGSLIRRDRIAEYQAKYGTSTAPLMEGPARVAYYYASPELRDHWAAIGGRKSFAEYAVERGVADAKMTARANKARLARDDAANRADESIAGQARRAKQKAEAAKRRAPLTAGDRFARDQRRRDRIRAQERKNAAAFERNGGTITPGGST